MSQSDYQIILGGDFNVTFEPNLDCSGGKPSVKNPVKSLEDIIAELLCGRRPEKWSPILILSRPVPIVLVKCWKVAHWNAKKLLKNCQKSKKLLPKFQKLLPYINVN